ncbi:MAG: hypothetical protein KDJ28_10440 [Candidatus Competibacteraceae bacterium]|nr:hypothetical protein [Candidatus Competibacteraceae bacterium]
MNTPGRVCPLRYRYGPRALAVAPERQAETLYVIGGLYGNRPALDAVEVLAATELGPVTLCFNGDFHWFDADESAFVEINARVLRHDALLGNVEAELLTPGEEAGCGCAYPETVDTKVVERSNQIHAHLKATAQRHPDALASLRKLPMYVRYRVGEARIGVVHGDAEALAGWRFDVNALDNKVNHEWLASAFLQADVEVFASSHTCLPGCRCFGFEERLGWIINNGAAGMSNFANTRFGVITRISTTPSPHQRLYGANPGPIHIDALALDFDADRWEREFLKRWPPASPAYVSYFERIRRGPAHVISQAAPPAWRAPEDRFP